MSKRFEIEPHLASPGQCISYFWSGLRPPPNYTIDEWADNHRVLPEEAADEAGSWRTDRVPYAREIMRELSPSAHTDDVVVMKGSQLGATEIGINFILHMIDTDPGPAMVVMPTIPDARKWSKNRLQPSISACPGLRAKVADESAKTGNSTLQKDYKGGTLVISGANSASSLRSSPIRYLVLDEIDGYPEDVDNEGDPMKLAERRTTNFSRRKRLYISTPTLADVSRIRRKFELSDQRYYYVPCPYCGKPQIIQWDNIRYHNDDYNTAYLLCSHCSEHIHEYHKTWMLANGQWIKHNPKSTTPGFHLSALYSPLGWYSWNGAVKDWLEAQGDPAKLKVFVNTVLGEVWEDSHTSIDTHWLAKRKESYSAVVPAPVRCLTAGADVQADRIECTIWGWGVGEESWIIDHSVFRGNPKQRSVWDLFDNHLLTQFEHESGAMMNVAAVGVDSGYSTDEVYEFCRGREHRRVFAVKGDPGAGRPIVGSASKNNRHRVYLFHVGVDEAKTTLYNRLMIEKPGPGYIHIPTVISDIFLQQLTAEKRVRRHHAGLPRLTWVLPSGKRNEALDIANYALAALRILNPHLETLARQNMVFTSHWDMARPKKRRRVLSKGVQV